MTGLHRNRSDEIPVFMRAVEIGVFPPIAHARNMTSVAGTTFDNVQIGAPAERIGPGFGTYLALAHTEAA